MPMVLEYINDGLGAKLVFDDDGKAAYAYLIIEGEIVSDVWLYNVGEPPPKPEWPDRDQMPFANSIEFISEGDFEPVNDQREIVVDWTADSSSPLEVSISLKGMRHAVLCPGIKPGWCRLAEKPSPIAKPLNETIRCYCQ